MKINGLTLAQDVLRQLKTRLLERANKEEIPRLSVILIGNDPASMSYIAQKRKAAEYIGIKLDIFRFPVNTPTTAITQKISSLSHDMSVHGIIIQRPVPPPHKVNELTQLIEPAKDVDGFKNESLFLPPLGAAVFKVLSYIYFYAMKNTKVPVNIIPQELVFWLKTKDIVLVGKGETGGQPVLKAMHKANLKPHVITSKTENAQNILKQADIIICAVGQPRVITPTNIKKGVILIGVGIHRKDDHLYGDYLGSEIKDKTAFYTPTPGGIGPLNVAYLMYNTLETFQKQTARKE